MTGNACAYITNIQKFSLDDGDGIRTVVFFKGCPLHCKWCANPETQHVYPELLWQADTCVRCKHCTQECKELRFVDQTLVLPSLAGAHPSLEGASSSPLEDQFKAAILHCPQQALELSGEAMSVDEVVEICLQDRPFYEESNGGVTFSGGEVLLWTDFACKVASKLHSKGISVAAETTGHANPQTFATLLRTLDSIYFDFKHWDETAHKIGTGQSNMLIKKNLIQALQSEVPLCVRIPVIPGFNDREALDAKKPNLIAAGQAFAHTLLVLAQKAERKPDFNVQLLPFHQLGEKKYEKLGRAYALQRVKALTREDLIPMADVMREQGLTAFV